MQIYKLSLINISLLLATALVGSLLIAKPIVSLPPAETPIFVEEELNVTKSIAIPQSISAPKSISISQPAPLSPINATPLPIFPPRITCQILPQYPALALERGLTGTTLLSIFVSKAGAPEKVEVKTSSGVAEFDESAAKAVAQWQFEPARQGGAAVASCLEVPVRFEVE
ncbi:MAG: energy transducer TonB [Candidatus Margulisbacteria bacterium]|nr:energy transducer TonB [Candidatus Margulisiibacteriota bacterium]